MPNPPPDPRAIEDAIERAERLCGELENELTGVVDFGPAEQEAVLVLISAARSAQGMREALEALLKWTLPRHEFEPAYHAVTARARAALAESPPETDPSPIGSLASDKRLIRRYRGALEEIGDAKRADDADPLEWATWAHDRARAALANSETPEEAG